MTSEMGLSQSFADFVCNLNYGDLPADVVSQTKRCLLDYLGVALAGSTTKTSEKIKKFLLNEGGEETVTAIGYGRKSDIFKAALANGMTAHILELDDGERHSAVHPGSSIISSVLALAERDRTDGRLVITSIVAGYEAALRIGKAIQPSHRKKGFHATATCGTLGAAVAASKMLNLSLKETSCAMGLAGTSASGLLQFLEDGSEMKQYHPGKAALLGLLAASIARSGITGPIDILEGKRGFFNCVSDEPNASVITAGLGEKFAIMDAYFKPYAACRHCHAPIEAALKILKDNNISCGDVEKIKVLTYKAAVDGHSDPVPSNETGAKMSLPFSVAVAVKTGCAGPKEFFPESFGNEDIVALSKKVEAVEDPALTALVPDKRSALVEITTKSGKSFSYKTDLPKGEPENPLTDEEAKTKFRELASYCRSEEDINNIADIVDSAEERISDLFRFLS